MDKTMGFYYRRMVQETAVHLWDLLDAAGTPAPLDGEPLSFDDPTDRRIALAQ